MGLFAKPTEVQKRYAKRELLGTGNFAKVFRAKRKEAGTWDHRNGISGTFEAGQEVAIKSIDKSKVEDTEDIWREIDILKQVNHPNVLQLYEVIDERKEVSLVMELATGGELFDEIVARGQFSESDAATTIFAVCSALDYLHVKKIVHRDLKPENILYASPAHDVIKLADFGLAKYLGYSDQKTAMAKTACGTPRYAAPEILKDQSYDSMAVDMWSVGAILYILLCGFPPFNEEELPALFDSIMSARYDFPSPWWDNISPDAKHLVRALLEVDPGKRLTAQQCIAHEFMKNGSYKAAVQEVLSEQEAPSAVQRGPLGCPQEVPSDKASVQEAPLEPIEQTLGSAPKSERTSSVAPSTTRPDRVVLLLTPLSLDQLTVSIAVLSSAVAPSANAAVKGNDRAARPPCTLPTECFATLRESFTVAVRSASAELLESEGDGKEFTNIESILQMLSPSTCERSTRSNGLFTDPVPVILLRGSYLEKRAAMLRDAQTEEERRRLALPRRQDLEVEAPEAFINAEEVRALEKGAAGAYRIVCASYIWKGAVHPDPIGEQLIRFVDAIEREKKKKVLVPFPKGEYAVFIE